MKMVSRNAIVAVLSVVLLVALAACAAAPAPRSGPAADSKAAPPAAPQSEGLSPNGSTGGAAPRNVSGPTDQGASTQASSSAAWDRMIIRTATLSLVVKDVEAAIAAVRDIAGSAGGVIAQSNTRYDGAYQVATITLQVPSQLFETAVGSLRQLAVKVETENGTSQDVTEEYTDLEAQVRNLQATEASFQRLMEKATSMQDIIALQRELTNVRGEIERRQGRLQYLTRRTEMSAITVSLKPEALAKQGQVWQPLQTARDAWEASQVVLLAIANILITLVVFLWWLIPLATLAWYIRKSRRGQHRPGASTPTA